MHPWPCQMLVSELGAGPRALSLLSWLVEDKRDPGVPLLLAASRSRPTPEDKQTDPVFSGRPYHLALGKELQYFPDYVCTQTSAAGKLCNPERGGVGVREEGLEGAPHCTPLLLAPDSAAAAPEVPCPPRQMGSITVAASPRCRRSPCTTNSQHKGSASAGVSYNAGVINGLFVKRPDQNAYIRHPGNLITEPRFTSHTHTPFFFEASVRSQP